MRNHDPKQLFHVALIGGMDRNQHQLIALAAEHGAELECHTGDVHGHRAEVLRAMIERSDFVVVLTDVNSHGGVIQARRWATHYQKPVTLLRRIGPGKLGSLLDQLRTARAA